VAANADYIVTNDRHFNVLETVEFPRVQCIRLQDFYEVLFGESMPENH
jgi:predicted nucleic acid-binding protein